MSTKEIITLGILAHVDAGKTSITESLLHHVGATRIMGSVDKGSAITDGLAIEKERGISIKASTVNFELDNKIIQLVDTPGHIDFAAEVDRSLNVLDAVILVVSAKEGVQSHTINLWEQIKERGLPVIVFFNKIDRTGVDIESVYNEFQNELQAPLFALNHPVIIHNEMPITISFKDLNYDITNNIISSSFENLAGCDDTFMEMYLEEKLPSNKDILQTLPTYFSNSQLCPALFGSAKLNIGIDDLLLAISNLLLNNPLRSQEVLAKVFKVQYHEKHGRLAYIKSYGSPIKTKDLIYSNDLKQDVKINQIFKAQLGGLEQVNELETGAIGMITTSETIIAGDQLGKPLEMKSYSSISESVLNVEVIAESSHQYQKLGEALELLNLEDPSLDLIWDKEKGQFFIKILGPIQTEILKEDLEKRWEIKTKFKSPKVIYKETPNSQAEGYVKYWLPKPCWAIMTFEIRPGERGSGVQFKSEVRTSDISTKYQNEVVKALPRALRQGLHGYEVTDIEISLKEGSEHTVHSNPGDFILATPMGIMRALQNAGTTLLEPMYAFDIKAPQDYLGPVTSDLVQMKSQMEAPIIDQDYFYLKGRVAVAEAMDYGIKFSATCSGKGRLKFKLDGYEPTSYSKEKTRPYQGVNPLDESQWILHMRGAFKADER